MIKNILDTLKKCKGETENIRIAKGKYYLPETFLDAFFKIKHESKWHK